MLNKHLIYTDYNDLKKNSLNNKFHVLCFALLCLLNKDLVQFFFQGKRQVAEYKRQLFNYTSKLII